MAKKLNKSEKRTTVSQKILQLLWLQNSFIFFHPKKKKNSFIFGNLYYYDLAVIYL